MDDFSDKLQSILSDSASMEKIREMAAGLMSGSDSKSNDTIAKQPEPTGLLGGGLEGLLSDAESMSKLVKVFSALNSGQDDERTRLLMALKPHLSPARAARVDQAVRMLRLLSIAPVLSQSGLLF